MQFKKIIAVAAALAASSAFAASIDTSNSGSGLFLVVTNTANGTSYDLDLSTTFAAFTAANNATTTTAQTWSLSDSNWTSFYSAANSANYVWTVLGSKSGIVSQAGVNHLLTTVNSATNLSAITSAAAGSISQNAGLISLVATDINTKSAGAASYVATQGADIAFVGNTGLKVDWKLNNKITSDFLTYNAVGTSSTFLDLSNTGTKSGGTYTESVFAGQFSFNGSQLTFANANVAPAVPEPSSFGLALVGLLLAGVVARRRA